MTKQIPPARHEHNYHPKYRPDIDGLRALAILPVVAYHSYPHSFPGGFAGVDVFFVISGFLISRIIFQSLRDGDFSFVEFYAHRVKRIFPALVVVLAACFAFGWFALLPEEFQQLGKHMAASAGFIQNFILWKEAGYFDTASELKPLLHLWSLAVEEQFYVFYPLLIWVVWRLRLNALAFLAVLALVSFALNIYGIGSKELAQTFFLPHTRYWELLAGAALAWHYHYGSPEHLAWLKRMVFHRAFFRQAPTKERQGAILGNIIAALGLFLILLSVFGLDRSIPYPGGWALLPVLGASCIIFADRHAWVNARILAWRPLVFIGLISYPLYLWHWPLLSFAHIMDESRIVALLLSFILAWLTYRLVERPVRFGSPKWRKTAVLCVLMTVLGYVGYNAYSREGLPFRQSVKDMVALEKENFEWERLGLLHDEACFQQFPSSRDQICKVAKTPPTVMLLGDSHANALYPGLAEATAADAGANVANLGIGGRAPFIGIESGPWDSPEQTRKQSALSFEQAIAYAESHPSVRTVIIASRGPLYLSGYFPWHHDEKQHDFTMSMPGRPEIAGNREIWRIAMRETLARLVAKGKQVIFVLDVAELGFHPKECMEYRPLRFSNRKLRSPCAISRQEVDERNREYREVVASVLKEFPTVKLFDAAAQFCDDKWCWAMKDGKILYRDGDHLSQQGSRIIGKELAKLLAPAP
jgi:peptidoglycan/LPS O-acetylase OafA/YrhL